MNERTIVMIDRAELVPHPENPRKDLGDLEELRESIRENGIMQNLTVVPDWDEDGYKILIGHRRWRLMNRKPDIVGRGQRYDG